MEHWCFIYHGFCKKVVQRMLQPSEVYARPLTVIHGTEFMAICCRDTDTCHLRRHLLTTAILSCNYLRMTCLMGYSERCSHTQTKHEMAIVKHSWVNPRKWWRNPDSHVITHLGGNETIWHPFSLPL